MCKKMPMPDQLFLGISAFTYDLKTPYRRHKEQMNLQSNETHSNSVISVKDFTGSVNKKPTSESTLQISRFQTNENLRRTGLH
jgi:hypothetical protein